MEQKRYCSRPHVHHVMISSNVSEAETLSLKLHYVAVHKASKYEAKVPTNANTPYRISFVEIISGDRLCPSVNSNTKAAK